MSTSEQMPAPAPPRKASSTDAQIGLTLAIISGIALLLSPLGYRWHWWELLTAFTVLRWSAYAGLAAVLISLFSLIVPIGAPGKRYAVALVGAAIGLVVMGIPWHYQRLSRTLPPIHDVTTDTANPPEFVAILPLRKGAPNASTYGGPNIAIEQRRSYPDITPLQLQAPAGQTFDRALSTARAMGWEIVATDQAAGRIEATTGSFWFGFKDDIVIRISAADGGSRVDVRSVSRIGRSDLGSNAQHIRAYFTRLKA